MKDIMHGRKRIYIVIIAFLVCAITAGAFLMYRRRPVKGIEIFPETEWLCENPVYYRQNDDAWKGDRMGTAVDTMGGSGCLVTCLAASMEMQAAASDTADKTDTAGAGERKAHAGAGRPGKAEMTPKKLNEELAGHQVYDERANILWNPLREYLTGWTVYTPSRPDGAVIEEMLNAGHFPIVKVRMPRSGASHWVVLVEARGGEYYCMDPLHREDELVPLSGFGNTVYSVRSVSYDGE